MSYRRQTMRGLRMHRSYVSHLYLNPGIAPAILAGRFDVALVSDFSPTMMLALAAARLAGTPVIISTDGQPDTDPGQHSAIHRLARRLVVPASRLGIGASRGSLDLLETYGLPAEAGVIIPLTPGWDFRGALPAFDERPFDLMFCGHLDDDRKGILFFADVVEALAARGRRLRIRITGDGPLRTHVATRLAALGVAVQFDGYLAQDALGAAYASAKIFLFPSRGDPWGLVANEAIQCGTPVIVSPHAQAGRELVAPSGAGIMLPLAVAPWADAVEAYLDNSEAWRAAQSCARAAADGFSLDAMVRGYLDAFAQAAGPPMHLSQQEASL
jgi:glycosyltransferase involved in cell wall biosynthesis